MNEMISTDLSGYATKSFEGIRNNAEFEKDFSLFMASLYGVEIEKFIPSLVTPENLSGAAFLFKAEDCAIAFADRYGLANIDQCDNVVARRIANSNNASLQLAEFCKDSEEWTFSDGCAVRDAINLDGTCVVITSAQYGASQKGGYVAAPVYLSKDQFIDVPAYDKPAYLSLDAVFGDLYECAYQTLNNEIREDRTNTPSHP